MFDLLDILLLSRGTPADDRTLAFRRIDGNPASNVIYFLPWFTPFWFAGEQGSRRSIFSRPMRCRQRS